MATIVKRNKALSVNPLKASQPVGAALAMLGIHRAMPLLHGSQGCTAFAKVFFVRHFREPIPLQTTAMEQVSTVMGADGNLIEGLATICSKSSPALIGVLTTGLSETQGSDPLRVVRLFRQRYPEYGATRVVVVNTPDYTGSLESGYAAAVEALIDQLVPAAAEAGSQPGRRRHQINVLASSMMTPGDIEQLKELIEQFGLRPVVVPDLSDSLDGHLDGADFSPLTVGGTPVNELATLGDAVATLVIGSSLTRAADLLLERTGVPDHRFDHLLGIEANDLLVDLLHRLSGRDVPLAIERQRSQLQDAMLDTHFMLGLSRVAIAADPDQLHAFSQLLTSVGAEVVAAVASSRTPILESVACETVKIGDLEDLESIASAAGVEWLVGNSHAVESARRLGVPLLRAGFPLYDQVGGYQRCWVGYRGARQALFDIANLLLDAGHHSIEPHRSILGQKRDGWLQPNRFGEVGVDGSTAASAHRALHH